MKLYVVIQILTFKLALAGDYPLVTTPYGVVQGTYSTSYKGLKYSQFLGIPYAQPPIGKLRFKEPQPLEKWSGIWIANLSTQCIQINHYPEPEGGNLVGQEDCLYLNVFVPEKRSQLLDVVVHIHSGAFNFGYGNCYAGPKYLMDINVVLVTFNYRLGPLGFLSTEDDVVSGNNGMKDQVELLRWVKNNIVHFGGNPNSVTITGLSAGGASVHYHYLSPLSEGLFNRGISVSGTALCPWSFQEAALEKTKRLAASVGCFQSSTNELIDCLRQRPAEQIVEGVRIFRPWLYNPFSPFAVVRERQSPTAFLSENPYEIIASGKVRDLPWLTSVTSEEGLYPAADFVLKPNYLSDLNTRWIELAPSVLDYNYTLPRDFQDSVSSGIKTQYFKNKGISRETYKEVVQMVGDRHFVVPAEKAARLQASVTKSPVFFYYFSYSGENVSTYALYYTNSEAKHGVSHGDDMMFVFSTPFREVTKMTTRDEAMKDVVLGIWETYVKTGTPKLNDIDWLPVSENLSYLHIKSPESVQMEVSKDLGNAAFWNKVPFQENEKLIV